VYCYKLINSIYEANKSMLEGLKLQKDWSATTQQKGAGSLADLIQSAREPDWAWPTFVALWQELQLPGRPPLLFTLDGLSHINKKSDYRDPEYKIVHAHDLVLVRTFVDALSGKTKLPNGGAVIAATSGSNHQLHPSQELVLSQLEAGQKGDTMPTPDPYEKGYDERVYDALKNTSVVRVEAVSKADARVLMEYWGASGMLRKKIDQHTVWSDWALSGHGIVGELERTSLFTIKM
jgi:small subunit ribosomal protein S29